MQEDVFRLLLPHDKRTAEVDKALTLLSTMGIVRMAPDDTIELLWPKVASQCSHPHDLPPPRRHAARALHTLMGAIYTATNPEPTSPCSGNAAMSSALGASDAWTMHSNPLALYTQLHRFSAQQPRPRVSLGPQPALRPILRPYQRDAVEWMLARERMNGVMPQRPIAAECASRVVRCVDGGRKLFWNACNGALSLLPPDDLDDVLCGGVLADEMGLGKTVEVLTLILAHPWHGGEEGGKEGGKEGGEECGEEQGEGIGNRETEMNDNLPCVCGGTPREFDGTWVGCDRCGRWVHGCCAGLASEADAEDIETYTCLSCACCPGAGALPNRSSLLICPASILGQWRQEVDKHVQPGGMRVAIYSGLREALALGSKRPELLAAAHPDELSRADLVLTTFEVLRTELNYVSERSSERSLRGGKHSSAVQPPASPLLARRWWRLIVDEAQMVESGTAKAAAMAQQLQAVNRWAVSGTPMGRNRLSDLQGLMSFLQLEPWNERAWWQYAIEQPLAACDRHAAVSQIAAVNECITLHR